ncbi:AMP-binding protein [Streptomyces sp. NBC_00663]|uniref:AMP-binding protein n=1 Tax=Streptomyces sp. NBC_00663 TaxID=2975801 RepID=UPI002E364AE8|nr:AMP-binding protein [Streptomyces sp. NBC_00663]
MSNLVTALAKAAERYPHQVAVQGGDEALNLAELDEFSARVAGGLLAHGVRPGDRVGLRLPFGVAFAALCFGVLRTGAVVVPSHPAPASFPEQRCGNALGARLVFIPPDTMAAEEAGRGGTLLVPVGQDFLSQVAFWPNHSVVVPRAGQDPAVLIRAGAATGMARDTVLSHRAVQDRSLAVAPHSGSGRRIYGLRAVLLSCSCLSATERSASPVSPVPAVSRGSGEPPAVTRLALAPGT